MSQLKPMSDFEKLRNGILGFIVCILVIAVVFAFPEMTREEMPVPRLSASALRLHSPSRGRFAHRSFDTSRSTAKNCGLPTEVFRCRLMRHRVPSARLRCHRRTGVKNGQLEV